MIFHTDAAQAAGKIPLDVAKSGIDLLSLTGHKYYGPKGAGALYVRRRKPKLELTCQIDGGGHENGLRSGTLNVPGLVGLGRAADVCREEMPRESVRLSCLRDRLFAGLQRNLDGVRLNGPSGDRRLPHNLHVSFDDIDGEALMALGDLAVSTDPPAAPAARRRRTCCRRLALSAIAPARRSASAWAAHHDEHIDFAIDRVTTVVRALRTTRVKA